MRQIPLRYENEAEYERDLLESLKSWGWQPIRGKDIDLCDVRFPVWEAKLREQLEKINDFPPGREKSLIVDKLISRLRDVVQGVRAGSEKPLQSATIEFLSAIRQGFTLDGKTYKFIDFKNWANNSFHAVEQLRFGKSATLDILLLVNGIPFVNIELKAAREDRDFMWEAAFDQIQVYQQMFPELYTMVQIGVVSEGDLDPESHGIRFFPTMPWRDLRGLGFSDKMKVAVEWHSKLILPDGSEEEMEDPLLVRLGFLYPPVLLDLLKYYIYVRRGKDDKIIARYMQYRAASRIFTRVKEYVSGRLKLKEGEKPGGVIWHWQGSGKSYTMAFAAAKLYTEKLEDASGAKEGKDIARTIFFVVDRNSLADQIESVLKSLEPGGRMPLPKKMKSIEELIEFIRGNNYRANRGYVITLIQKFRGEADTSGECLTDDEGEDPFAELIRECQRLEKQEHKTVLTSKDITVFVDEGHRSHTGKLGKLMRSIFANAPMFAFTGTPKFTGREEDDTVSIFGPILDRYFIKDSLDDGYTLPLMLVNRLPKVHLDEQRMNQAIEEIRKQIRKHGAPESIIDEVERRVAEKLRITDFLGNDQRMELIAEDIAKHFLDAVNEKFKALVVAPSRELAAKYRKLINDALCREAGRRGIPYTPEWIEAVFSGAPESQVSSKVAGESKYISEYIRDVQKRYGGKSYEEHLKPEFINKFKADYSESPNPRMLVVTSMLLTGYDVPVLGVMYFDKFMTDGGLLQALARVNRPYPGKEYGVIFDYVGLLGRIKDALMLYQEDAEVLATFVSPRDALSRTQWLLEELEEILKEVKMDDDRYLDIETVVRSQGEERQKLVRKLRLRIASQWRIEGSKDPEVRTWRKAVRLAKRLKNQAFALWLSQWRFERKEREITERAVRLSRFVLDVHREVEMSIRKIAGHVRREAAKKAVGALKFDRPPDLRESSVVEIDLDLLRTIRSGQTKSVPAEGLVLQDEFAAADKALRTIALLDDIPLDLRRRIQRAYETLRKGEDSYARERFVQEAIKIVSDYKSILGERERYGLSVAEYNIYRVLREYFQSVSLEKNFDELKPIIDALLENAGMEKKQGKVILDNLEFLDPDYKALEKFAYEPDRLAEEIIAKIEQVLGGDTYGDVS